MKKRTPEATPCNEYRRWSRRDFLKTTAAATAAVATAPSWMPRVAMAQAGPSRDVFVCIFLRGAIDGLTAVVPYGDPDLYAARTTLAIAPPGQTDGALDLDGFFGFAPAMAPLLPAYQDGALAVVHATGSPDPSRSHFEASSIMERAIPNMGYVVSNGWLTRYLENTPPKVTNNPLRAASIGRFTPESLLGAPSTVPMEDPTTFRILGNPRTRTLHDQFLYDLYDHHMEPARSVALDTIDTVALLGAVSWDRYAPTVTYPTSDFGQALQHTAALIKADVGVEVITIDLGGWDTHAQQGNLTGTMASLMDDLAGGLAAFYADMQPDLDKVTLVAKSEFGRRVAENGSAGTDHGHGNCMFVLGGSVRGGQVHGTWPGLATPNLFEGMDLAITTDYRDVLAEIVSKRLGGTPLQQVFPNYTPTFPGVIS